MTPSARLVTGLIAISALAAGSATVTSGASAADNDDPSLRRAAAVNDMSVDHLRELLATDETAALGVGGRLLYRDPAAPSNVAPTTPAPAAAPLGETFELHSLPGANRTVFLDFDGATISNGAWNTGPGSTPNGSHPAWDPSGNGSGFSNAELTAVQDIWQRVAEDFAPFAVDVTTEDPGEAALTRANAGDQVFGMRALITPSDRAHDDICDRLCGGVAYIGVFNVSEAISYQPAWIFTEGLSNDVKSIAEATTHEVGHTLGLEHDGTTGLDYYVGHSSWAPIMGEGYGRPVVQWSQGAYGSADQPQDDLAVIASTGAPARSDDVGNTVGTAGALPDDTRVIGTRGDRDVFALGTCTGQVVIEARPAPISPNLDIELALLDASGTVVGTADEATTTFGRDTATGLGATLAESVGTGAYFVRVDGVGQRGNTSPVTGYDDYGSLGTYEIAVDGCDDSPVTPPPDPEPEPEPEPEVTAPSAPGIGAATSGAKNRKVTASVRWSPPAATGGAPVDGYQVYAYRLTRRGSVKATLTTDVVPPGTRRASVKLPRKGRYAFAVRARNSVGFGPLSARSRVVRGR